MNFKLKKIKYLQSIPIKYNLYFYIFYLIVITSCSDKENLILTNTFDPDTIIEDLNLHSLDSGQNLETVTINWNSSFPATINNDDNIFPPYEISINSGEFSTITLDLNIEEGENLRDSIQIFTRPVYPVTNFSFEVSPVDRGNLIYDEGEIWTDLDSNDVWDSGEDFIDKEYAQYHRLLTWEPSKETDDNFEKYMIFRSTDPDSLINTENCDCIINTLNIKTDSSYTDSSSSVIEEQNKKDFFYRVQTTTKNSYRNSYIDEHTNFNSPPKIELNTTDTTSNDGFIIINWDPIDNQNLNHYEIWRSKDGGINNQHLIATILYRVNPSLNYFMDRNVGNGTTWFYSIAVVDINGNKKFSKYIEKWSKP